MSKDPSAHDCLAADAAYPTPLLPSDSNLQPLIDPTTHLAVSDEVDALSFRAVAFRDLTNKAVIFAFNGTVRGLTTYRFGTLTQDTFNLDGSTLPVVAVAKNIVSKHVEPDAGGTSIYVTGHSLGGLEAEAVAEYLGSAIAGGKNPGGGGDLL